MVLLNVFTRVNMSNKPARFSSTIASKGRADYLQSLRNAGSNPGEQRKLFLASVSALSDDDVALTVGYGQTNVSVNKHGLVIFPDGQPTVGLGDLTPGAIPGSAPLNKKVGDSRIPCGVCLILAGGGFGKTPLANSLAAFGVDSYSAVRVGEPLAGYTSSSFEAAYALASALITSQDVVLDSIKDLLSGGGAAMKSGLSRDALVSISGWAAMACDVGSTIYVPVNPSTPDPEVLELLAEISKSNATMTIVTAGKDQWAYSSRTGEGLPRDEGKFNVKFDRDGLAQISGSKTGGLATGEFSKYVTTALSVDAWTQAQRRAITAAN